MMSVERIAQWLAVCVRFLYWLYLCKSVAVQQIEYDVIDNTGILQTYVTVCGANSMCKLKADGEDNPECAQCSCTDDCHVTGTCCPDVSMSSCISVDVVRNSNENYFIMVNVCPHGTDRKLVNKCATNLDKHTFLDFYPVYSVTNHLAYKNRYCAECHAVNDWTPLQLQITCGDRNNFNFYSTPESLHEAFVLKKCDVMFVNDEMSLHGCDKYGMITTCNVTGLWDEYDSDVEWACLNTFLPYNNVFPNVYCYICNTGITSGKHSYDVIDTCPNNSTSEIKKKCEEMGLNKHAYPYKNFFCLSCNEQFSLYSDSYRASNGIKDISVYINQMEDHPYVTVITFDKVSPFFMNDMHSQDDVIRKSTGIHSPYSHAYHSPDVNMTDLVHKYVKFNGSLKLCHEEYQRFSSIHASQRNCSCSRSCIASGTCCPDVAFSLPVGCVPTKYPSTKADSDYVMIDHCPKDFNDKNLTFLCENPTTIGVPVWNDVDRVTYKNFHCFLCNNNIKSIHVRNKTMQMWSVQIECKTNVIFSRFPSLRTLLHAGIIYNCTFQYFSERTMTSHFCRRSLVTVKRCNATGWWPDYNRDIEQACENLSLPITPKTHLGVYDNIFCEMCNSPSKDRLISVCNITGMWQTYNRTVEALCESGPPRPYAGVYMNWYCSECNMYYEHIPLGRAGGGFGFRDLFSIVDFLDSQSRSTRDTTELQQGRCDDGYIDDHYRGYCRKLYCAPGKRVVNGSCLTLLPMTSSLKYVIPIKLRALEFKSTKDLRKVFFSLKPLLSSSLSDITDTLVSTTSYAAESNIPCGPPETSNDVTNREFEILIHATVETGIGILVHRTSFEAKLFEALKGPLNVTFEDYNAVTFAMTIDKQALLLPVLNTIDERHFCKLYRYYVNNEYPAFLVSDLLFCKQVELDKDEYERVDEGNFVRTLYTDRKLDIDMYMKRMTGSIRVCVENYQALRNIAHELTEMDHVLSIITYLCTSISLISLVATFIIYCLIPRLWTIPGKNIMCVCLSLFLAQFSFLIGSVDVDEIFCQVNGVFIHYFWLSTFCWMNICSFHMFRVFSGRLVSDNSVYSQMKIFRKYFIYSFGTPLMIITITTVVYISKTGGSEIGYGGVNCFIKEFSVLVAAFLVPVIIISVCNIVFFSVTLFKIRNSPQVESTRSDRHNLAIYIKLFTITGITWVLQIIDGLFPTSPFSFLVTLLNGSQGVFIFISYVCNKRVFDHLRGLQMTSVSSTSNRQTNSMPLTSKHSNTTESNI